MEIWKDVKGFEGFYKASNKGRIKSLDRYVYNSAKTKRFVKGIILKNSIGTHGYNSVMLTNRDKRKRILVHKLIFEAFYGVDSNRKIVIDHINDNKLDNRLENLQLVSNRFNSTKKAKGYSSYVGVSYNKKRKKYNSAILVDGKSIFLGTFDCEYKAHLAYQKKLKQIE